MELGQGGCLAGCRGRDCPPRDVCAGGCRHRQEHHLGGNMGSGKWKGGMHKWGAVNEHCFNSVWLHTGI